MEFAIYALIDPRDYSTRYIGVSENLIDRFIQHLRCRGNNARKNAWIRELEILSLVPIMKTLEMGIASRDLAIRREMYWMHHYRYLGLDLLNAAMPAAEITQDEFIQSEQPEGDPPKLIGLTYAQAAKLPECKQAHVKSEDLRRAVRRGEIKPKRDGSLTRHSVITWLRKQPA